MEKFVWREFVSRSSNKYSYNRPWPKAAQHAMFTCRVFVFWLIRKHVLNISILKRIKLHHSRLLQLTHACTGSWIRVCAGTGERADHCPKPGENYFWRDIDLFLWIWIFYYLKLFCILKDCNSLSVVKLLSSTRRRRETLIWGLKTILWNLTKTKPLGGLLTVVLRC